MPILTLTTDFGTADHYVAAVKGVILGLAPATSIVDVSHDVPPGDVETAAWLLRCVAPAFPAATVHLAVVDPGVGSARRILVADDAGALFVGPDNGVLDAHLGSGRVRAVDRPDLWRDGPGATFHGRDRLAPLAAFLLRGGDVAELGPLVDDPVRLGVPPPTRSDDVLRGCVRHVDHYGNLVTDLPSDWLPDGAVAAEIGSHTVRSRAAHYAELGDEPGLMPGSSGTLELALRGESLARRRGPAHRRRDTVDTMNA